MAGWTTMAGDGDGWVDIDSVANMDNVIENVRDQNEAVKSINIGIVLDEQRLLRMFGVLKLSHWVLRLKHDHDANDEWTDNVWTELADLLRVNTLLTFIGLPHRMGNDKVSIVLGGLHGNGNLISLSVAGCRLEGAEGARIIRQLLLQSCVRELDLSFDNVLFPEGVSEALGSNQYLEKLRISNTFIDVECMQNICRSLIQNKVLKGLSLNYDCFPYQAFVALCGLLRESTSLKYFHMAGYRIDSDGKGVLLVESLKVNFTLQDCHIRMANMAAKYQCAISFFLKRNKVMPLLLRQQDQPSIPPGLWPHVFEWCLNQPIIFGRQHWVVQHDPYGESLSLVHHILCTHSNGLVETDAGAVAGGKRKRPKRL